MRIEELTEPAGASLAAVAVADRSRALRRGELIAAVAEEAARLRAAGVREHHRVAARLGDDVGSVVRWLACLRAAGSVLAVAPGLTGYEQARLDAQFGTQVTVSGAGVEHAPAPPGARDGTDDPLARCIALATSGTSGAPKVVARDLPSVVDNARAWAAAAGIAPGAAVVTTTPLHHSYGMGAGMAAALASGATLRILAAPVNLAAIPDAVSGPGPVTLLSIPFVYRRLARRPAPGRAGGLTVVSAGESIDEETAAVIGQRWGTPVRDHLGTSELGQLTIADGPGQGAGRPVAGVTAQDRPVPGDDERELYWQVRGASPRYVEQGQPRGCLAGGWFASGDLGRVEAGGWVRISGRRSQRLNLAGRKVDPAEVEAVLRDFPGVAGAAVTMSGGHDPCLCALIQGPRLPDVPALRRHLASHLSSYKIPQRYLRVDQLPVTASGKLIRHALADLIPPDKGERP